MKINNKTAFKKTIFIIILIAIFILNINYISAATINNETGSSLNEAIQNSTNNETILMEEGIYQRGVNSSDEHRDYGIIIDKNITIIGNSNSTIIDLTGKDSRAFNITKTGYLTLINITIRNSNQLGNKGGIIYNEGFLSLINCTFINNTLYGNLIDDNLSGGVIYNSGSNVLIENSSFINNKLISNNQTASGAVIYNNGDNLTIKKFYF
ncbi:hypothetical protein [Methanobrevibacter arboriphilus]|uniref:hypothetical protein n=1 Tax=Methanobrevibacter arboriphilus TaxID=39441 RepID=UPI000A6FCEFC|nr:hypothetical protein [Methanobrevibacter arboriphilus]